jgi:serine/threonine-protein kinase RCK2
VARTARRNVAPEVLDPDLERKAGYGPEVDLWAAGVMLYSMLCGFPPFYSEDRPALARQIRRGEYRFHSPYWDGVSFGAKDLVASLLVVDPARRHTCHRSLQHPWIKKAVEASSQKLHRCPPPPGPALRLRARARRARVAVAACIRSCKLLQPTHPSPHPPGADTDVEHLRARRKRGRRTYSQQCQIPVIMFS